MNIAMMEQKRFWKKDHKDFVAESHLLLTHAILDGFELRLFRDLKKLFLIEPETLQDFACGVFIDFPTEWLVLPYQTGYTRVVFFNESVLNDGRETHVMIEEPAPGSLPYVTFFGLDNLQNKETLFITESPFETMLLWQYLQHEDDVSGDVIGIIPNKKLSPYPTNSQLELIDDFLEKSYSSIYLIINDAPSLVKRLIDFIPKNTNNKDVDLHTVNIPLVTEGRFMTYLDVMKNPHEIDFMEPLRNSETVKLT